MTDLTTLRARADALLATSDAIERRYDTWLAMVDAYNNGPSSAHLCAQAAMAIARRDLADPRDAIIRSLLAALPAEQPASLTVGAPEAWRIEEFGKPTFVVMMAGRAEHYRRIGAKVTPLVPLSEADDDPAGRGGL